MARLPYSLKVLLENVLRLEDGAQRHARPTSRRSPAGTLRPSPAIEIPFQPARVLMQDFTGVPAVVDLAAMRDAMAEIGGDPAAINPLVDVDLVIDHSVQVDAFGNARAFAVNAEREFERNRERYSFLKWGQRGLRQLQRRAAGDRDLPPGQPRAHLPGRLQPRARRRPAAPTPTRWSAPTRTRRWSTGSACSAGGSAGSRPRRRCSASRSRCCCRRWSASSSAAKLPEGATATDLVLTVTEMLRERGVVSKFVEFFGPGLPTLGLADRATIGNMSPEFGSTCAIFPVDAETLRYLELTGRPTETIELVDAYAREQGMFHERGRPDPVFSDAGARPGRGRAEHRRAEAAAGPGAAGRGQAGLPGGDGRVRPRGGRAAGQRRDEAIEESFPASDPPAEDHDDERGKPRPALSGGPVATIGARQRRRDRGDARGRRRASSSTTAAS